MRWIICLLVLLGSSAWAQPNFVILFIDDMGYGDLGCYGSKVNQTPRIDRMAAEGMRFTSFYAQTVCGPSRGALMTGRYPGRIGGGWLTRSNEVTLAETLKAKGYRTAAIGKWDMSYRRALPQVQPNDQGFDEYFGTLGANDGGRVTLRRNKTDLDTTADMGSLTKRYTEEAVEFLKRQKKGEPFFLYLAHTMVHVQIGASAEFIGKSTNDLFGDAVAELDWSTGRVLDTIKEMGLDEDTYVLLTSDNGPWSQPERVAHYIETHGGHLATGSAGPLRGFKGSSWEGGYRVPAIMWAPGRVPAGKVSDAIFATLDIHPTFANLAGAKPPGVELDGVDQTDLIRGKSKKGERDVFHFYNDFELQAFRKGRWKLALPRTKYRSYVIRTPIVEPQLYDLETDLGEENDVAAEHPEVTAELMKWVERARAESADWAPEPRPER